MEITRSSIDTAGFDAGFMPRLGAAEPRRRASVDRAYVEVVAVADDPDRHRPSLPAVTSHGRDLELLGAGDPV